jgi:hypothetical protein
MSYRIAQNKKPHTIAETVIPPTATDMIQTMFGEIRAQQFRNVPLSQNMVSRWIADASEDIEEQPIVMLRHKRFPIQAEESTGYNGSGYLVA